MSVQVVAAVADSRRSCVFCRAPIEPPFVYWNIAVRGAGGNEVWICQGCCVDMRKGLMADMVQVAAIVELQQFDPQVTLTRRRTLELLQEQEQRRAQNIAVLRR